MWHTKREHKGKLSNQCPAVQPYVALTTCQQLLLPLLEEKLDQQYSFLWTPEGPSVPLVEKAPDKNIAQSHRINQIKNCLIGSSQKTRVYRLHCAETPFTTTARVSFAFRSHLPSPGSWLYPFLLGSVSGCDSKVINAGSGCDWMSQKNTADSDQVWHVITFWHHHPTANV